MLGGNYCGQAYCGQSGAVNFIGESITFSMGQAFARSPQQDTTSSITLSMGQNIALAPMRETFPALIWAMGQAYSAAGAKAVSEALTLALGTTYANTAAFQATVALVLAMAEDFSSVGYSAGPKAAHISAQALTPNSTIGGVSRNRLTSPSFLPAATLTETFES